MKRQDDSGENTLHVDGGGSSGGDVNITEVGGTPVTSPLPVSIASVPGDVTVVQPTGTNLHVVTDTTSTTIATQATGTNLHTVVDSGTITLGAGAAVIGHVITDTGSTTAVTGNVTVVQGTGTNLHTVLDSGTLTTVSTVTAVTAITNPVISSVESGTVYNGTTALTPKFAVISASSSGDNTIVGAVALKKIRVLQWSLMASGTVNAKWQSAAGGTDKTGLYYFVANTGVSVPFAPTGLFETIAGELLNLNLSAGVAVGGSLVYLEV